MRKNARKRRIAKLSPKERIEFKIAELERGRSKRAALQEQHLDRIAKIQEKQDAATAEIEKLKAEL